MRRVLIDCVRLLTTVGLMFYLTVFAFAAPSANWVWIWADGHAVPDTVYFRHRFQLPGVPISAKLSITASDVFTAYVNDSQRPVAQGADPKTVQQFDVTRYLIKGDNLLAIRVQNTIHQGGLLYRLSITLPGGAIHTVISNGTVRSARRVPPSWKSMATDEGHWSPSFEVAAVNEAPYGVLHGVLRPDPARIIRLWDIHAGAPDADPYARSRNIGERMLLGTDVTNPTDMRILSGEGFTLFQTDSDYLSTEETGGKGGWDWHRQNVARRTVQQLTKNWCYFPHEAFPPEWYRKTVPFTPLQCLEHQQPVQAFSPWDPTWPDFIDHGYEAMANEFEKVNPDDRLDPISAIDVGIHGDYGQSGFISGERVEIPGQKEEWLRRFGNLHDHLGWWCADPVARSDFRETMVKKYGSLDHLNAAWKRTYKTPEEIVFPSLQGPRQDAKQEWLDFVTWYQTGITHAIDLNLAAARKHFPETLLMLPGSFGDEDLRRGSDNSLIPKLAAKYHADVRVLDRSIIPFADNAATMLGRLGSASRFYGVPFWLEPSNAADNNQEVERIFEAVSQGAKGIFDWETPARASREVYYRYGKYLRVEKPVVDVAMFYPAEAQKLRPEQGFEPLFAQACAKVRDIANFDIVDDRMVLDGCLSKYRILALWEGTQADPATLERIKQWVSDGGVLLAYDFGKVTTFDGDSSWFKDLFGYIQELAPAKVTERFTGVVPAQYQIRVGLPEAADYLDDGWYGTAAATDIEGRWTKAVANIRLPVDPSKSYVLVVRTRLPTEAGALKRKILLNGHEVGDLAAAGDVTYRFHLSRDVVGDRPIATLTFQSDTFQPSKLITGSKDMRFLGVEVLSVQVVEHDVQEVADATAPVGKFRRDLDLNLLNSNWSRLYGKGLTIYFPANQKLIKGYIEVLRRAIYHLSEIDKTRRDALPIDDAVDGLYATLLTDKILYYNSTDKAISRMVAIPKEAFVAWKGEVAIPSANKWELTIEPHSIASIDLTPAPAELLFECEGFTNLNGIRPVASPECSPGKGTTCVPLGKGQAITTTIAIPTPGRYTIYTRCIRGNTPEPVEVVIDGLTVAPTNARAAQTLLAGTMTLTAGEHTLTIRSKGVLELRADFILLTSDSTIAGYDFALRATPVE